MNISARIIYENAWRNALILFPKIPNDVEKTSNKNAWKNNKDAKLVNIGVRIIYENAWRNALILFPKISNDVEKTSNKNAWKNNNKCKACEHRCKNYI